MKPVLRISLCLPLLSLLLSASIIAVPASRTYLLIHHSQQTSSDYVDLGSIAVRKADIPRLACEFAARPVYGPIAALNAPAFLVDALISIPEGPNANWFALNLGLEFWRVISYPIFALPAWWFVGRGTDALRGAVRVRWADLIVSFAFSIFFAVLSVGLLFGLTDAERKGQDSLGWFTAGLAIWAVLFSVPAFAWARAKIKLVRKPTESPELSA